MDFNTNFHSIMCVTEKLSQTFLPSDLGEIHFQRPLVAWWRHSVQSTVARPFCKINILFAHLLPVCPTQGPFKKHCFTSIWLFSLVHMGVRRNFSKGGATSTFCFSFSGCWRCNANARSQTLCPFYTTKKRPHVAAAVTKKHPVVWDSEVFFRGVTSAVSDALYTPQLGRPTLLLDAQHSVPPPRGLCGIRSPDKASTSQIKYWNSRN